VLAAALVSGCTSSSPPPISGHTLRINWGGFPDSWAPGAEGEAGYTRVPYENLVSLVDGRITPVLATSWQQTDTALTLSLRHGVVFHDGTPFDAAAVKVNLEAARDFPGPFAGPLKVISSIDVIDDYTVRLNLSQPAPSLLTVLSTRATPMASPAAIEDGSIVSTPVGTGPWAYDAASSIEGVQMTFRYFDKYWGGPDSVGFDTVELYGIPDLNQAVNALLNGEIDLTNVQPDALPQLQGRIGFETMHYNAIRNNPIFFDRGPGEVFSDVRIRQAACYALDTGAVAQAETDMVPQSQHFSENEVGYNTEITGYPHDLDRAKQLYAQAGRPPINISVLAAPFTEVQVDTYAAQLRLLGWTVTVELAPPAQWAATWSSGKYPLGLGDNDELTPYEWYKAWFAADAPGNPSGYESPELRSAADAAMAAGSSDQAAPLWSQVTKIINDEALTCAHVAGQSMVAWNSATVTGVAAPDQPWEPNLVNLRALHPANVAGDAT
jgi:peptide/nickel transport system substrate-binding protein